MAKVRTKTLTAQHDAVDLSGFDLNFYSFISVQYGAGGAGTLVLEGSNDGVTWISAGLTPIAGGSVVTTIAASGIWFHQIVANFYRVRKSVAGEGGVDVTVNIHRT
jgi:hypothetical protein